MRLSRGVGDIRLISNRGNIEVRKAQEIEMLKLVNEHFQRCGRSSLNK